MSKDYRKEVEKFIQQHKFLTLATCSKEQQPGAHVLGYSAEGATVYFSTSKDTRKVSNILSNAKVAYTIEDENHTDWTTMLGLQMEAVAELVENEAEIAKVQELFNKKFPEFADMPQDPNLVIIKLLPKKANFLDSTVAFGFSAIVDY